MGCRLAVVVVALMLAVMPAARAGQAEIEAEAAVAVVRQFSAILLDTMKNGPKLGFKGRAEKLRPAVVETYDMPAMTRSTLGTAANKLTPDEAARLSETYTHFSVATYAAQFDDWEGERFDVGVAHPSTGGSVIVPSWIAPQKGDPTEIDYVLRQTDGHWRVVDVLFDGTVSQVAVRRSEFTSIFRAKGLSGLIETIEKQTAALEK